MSTAALESALTREPAKRELYLAALAFAAGASERVDRFSIEAVIDQRPERTAFFQPAGSLVDALVGFGALDEKLPEPEYDEDAEEEFIDMAKATYGLTPEGVAALEEFSPHARLTALFACEPERAAGFRSLMVFCAGQARTRREIDGLLAPFCESEKNTRHVAAAAIYPSYYVDRLERAGALQWSDGWTTTEEAQAFLAVFQ